MVEFLVKHRLINTSKNGFLKARSCLTNLLCFVLGDQTEVLKIMNGYEGGDRNMFFKLKEGSRIRGHKAALVKEQCRLDNI